MNAPSAELHGHVDGGHIDGVIFDCDGVLVDSERISNGTWALLLTEIGLPMTMEQSLGIFMGNSMPRCVEIVAEMMGHAPPDDLLARFTANVTVALQRDLELIQWARDAAVGIIQADPMLSDLPLLRDELDLLFSDTDEEFLFKS